MRRKSSAALAPASSVPSEPATLTEAKSGALTEPKPEKPKSSKRLQMADIARLAGVSTATVSRALAGNPNIREETRIRIEELARAVNYSVNFAAQNLRMKENRTISVVIPYDRESRQHITDPFFLTMLGSLADAVTELNYELLLSRIDEDQLDTVEQLYRTGRAAGIIIIGQWHHHEQLNELASHRVPLVVWGAQQAQQVYCSVGSDNLLGGRLAAEHLLALGRKRVLFLGDTQLPEVGQRYQGYLAAHEQAGVTVDTQLQLRVPFVVDRARQTLNDWLDQTGRLGSFDAVFAASDLLAMTAIGALMERGIRVPEDVSVVGYDDLELASYFHPGITTIRQPIPDGARLLVNKLLEQLQGDRAGSEVLPTSLVVRASAG